jgi:D-sedoheptulose 7-phosphate isomerase
MKSEFCEEYTSRLKSVLSQFDWDPVIKLGNSLRKAWKGKKRVFICGNGGSAGNANHLANDFLYGISRSDGIGLRVLSLSSNPSIITCLANDITYENIYSQQLAVQGDTGDILIVLSGSGNSPNIIKVLEMAKEMKIISYAVLGFDGGKCLEISDVSIHFEIQDMQISEDLQMIVGHMLMQWLSQNHP